VPSAFIGNSVGKVFFKQVSDRYNAEKLLRPFLLKTWGVLFLITIIPTTVLLIWSEPLFAFVFGEQWSTAGTIAMILAPLLAIDFISAPTGRTLIVLEKQKFMPLFSLINLIARAGGLFLGWYQSDFFMGLIYMVTGHIFGLIIYNLYLIRSVNSYESSIRFDK
jgi:O-antigen/teichoic acid export membrane protein